MTDNPQAFPCLDNSGEGFGLSMRDPGMTLRDWFAGQALAARAGNQDAPHALAAHVYTIADAMLKARNTP